MSQASRDCQAGRRHVESRSDSYWGAGSARATLGRVHRPAGAACFGRRYRPVRYRNGLVLVAAAAVGLVSPAPGARADAPTITVRDVRGVTVTLKRPPVRIVSLAPAITEILFTIGAGPQVAGVTAFCDYPAKARSLPRVGDLNVNAEKVLALRPDLVIGDIEANRKALAALGSLSPLRGKLFAVAGSDFREIMAAVGSIGAVVGRCAEADRAVRAMEKNLAAIRKRLAVVSARPRTVFIVQPDPLWVAGTGTFVDDLITAAGGHNLGRHAGRGYRSFSLERLIALNPDVIISSDSTLAMLRKKPGWSTMKAVRLKRVYRLGYDAVRPGPRLVEAVKRLHGILHP